MGHMHILQVGTVCIALQSDLVQTLKKRGFNNRGDLNTASTVFPSTSLHFVHYVLDEIIK